jgi:hypothetical protein
MTQGRGLQGHEKECRKPAADDPASGPGGSLQIHQIRAVAARRAPLLRGVASRQNLQVREAGKGRL